MAVLVDGGGGGRTGSSTAVFHRDSVSEASRVLFGVADGPDFPTGTEPFS